MLQRIKEHRLLGLFVVLYLLFAFFQYKNIPIGNGEEYRLLRGKETLVHFIEGNFTEKLLQPVPNYFLYNLYPMFLVLFNPNFYYEWFHLMNLLFALFGFLAVYMLIYIATRSVKYSMLGLIVLVFFPRFFGELGFNPVDMPFMVFYLWSLIALLLYSRKGAAHWSILLIGVLFGITQGIRQLGFSLYFVIFALDIYDTIQPAGVGFLSGLRHLWRVLKGNLLKYVYIFIIANFFMLITWPNFAVNFFKSYAWYLFVGSNFYLWDFGLLFFGRFLENYQRPWYYLPFFQLIMYPPYVLGLLGLAFVYFKRLVSNRIYFLLLTVLVINFALYFALQPVLYDGLRHFLFLIPVVVALGLIGLRHFYTVTKSHFAVLCISGLFILGFFFSVRFTLKEYPYQYAYFNSLAYVFGNPYQLFESDYANTLYRRGAEWLRDEYLKDESVYSHSDPDKMLKVYACDNAYALDYYSHKKFLSVIHKGEADIVVCDYRNKLQSGYKGEVIKEFGIAGNTVLYVMQMH